MDKRKNRTTRRQHFPQGKEPRWKHISPRQHINNRIHIHKHRGEDTAVDGSGVQEAVGGNKNKAAAEETNIPHQTTADTETVQLEEAVHDEELAVHKAYQKAQCVI